MSVTGTEKGCLLHQVHPEAVIETRTSGQVEVAVLQEEVGALEIVRPSPLAIWEGDRGLILDRLHLVSAEGDPILVPVPLHLANAEGDPTLAPAPLCQTALARLRARRRDVLFGAARTVAALFATLAAQVTAVVAHRLLALVRVAGFLVLVLLHARSRGLYPRWIVDARPRQGDVNALRVTAFLALRQGGRKGAVVRIRIPRCRSVLMDRATKLLTVKCSMQPRLLTVTIQGHHYALIFVSTLYMLLLNVYLLSIPYDHL